MLVRFVINNVYSFGEQKEFNMLPQPRYKPHNHHKYSECGLNLLKMASIYGANGAGKSNLVKALDLLKDIVTTEMLPANIQDIAFKFNNDKSILFAIEFISNSKVFIYGLEISRQTVITEELYLSGVGKRDDELIFERKTNNEGSTQILFSNEFMMDSENQILKKLIEKSFSKSNKPIFKLLTTLKNPQLELVGDAYQWFEDCLQIIFPSSKPAALAHHVDIDDDFKKYTIDILKAFDIGIVNIVLEKKQMKEFFGDSADYDIEELIKNIEESPSKMIALRNSNGDELIIVKENNDYIVKHLFLEHLGIGESVKRFDLDEESDGTLRLLDFIPAFKVIVSKKKVFIIDEIERSMHPVLIKKLIKKFSSDENTKGQLVFTTHECNLLDQSIFRQDEIWFAEKDRKGCTDLYSLSDYKEHNTIDIRKGYLNGRYGSIPFLGNLDELNWHSYDTTKT